jgi:hypothetical protein
MEVVAHLDRPGRTPLSSVQRAPSVPRPFVVRRLLPPNAHASSLDKDRPSPRPSSTQDWKSRRHPPPRVSGPHHRYERLAPDYVTVLASPTTASRPISRRLRFSVWRSVDLRRWPTVQLSDRGRFTSRTYSSECMPLLKLWLRWNLLATNFAGLAQVSFSLDRQVLLALKSLQWCTFRQNNHIAVTTSRTAAATH